MKECFTDILNNLSISSAHNKDMSGMQHLEAEVCYKVNTSLRAQLDYMKFFQTNPDEEVDEQTVKKMELAPLTNSGCESNFSQLDLECRRGSGQTTLQTMSNRHMVKTNQFFDSEQWKQLAPELKAKSWKEARSGEQAKIVKGLQEEFP